MMTEKDIQIEDKELLTLAAKAVGIDLLDEEWEDGFIYYYHKIPGDTQGWNPLNCDSDALRLAVKLGMLFRYMHERFDMFQQFYLEELDNDLRPSEATRRAIVRAAAEIGMTMV